MCIRNPGSDADATAYGHLSQFGKTVDDNDSLVAAVDAIVGEMHEDGTLTAMSEQWYEGLDYTTQQ